MLRFRVHYQRIGQGRPNIGIFADRKLTLSPRYAPAVPRADAVIVTSVEPQTPGQWWERPAKLGPGLTTSGHGAQVWICMPLFRGDVDKI